MARQDWVSGDDPFPGMERTDDDVHDDKRKRSTKRRKKRNQQGTSTPSTSAPEAPPAGNRYTDNQQTPTGWEKGGERPSWPPTLEVKKVQDTINKWENR